MNVENVPETKLTIPWLWVPGPIDNLYLDLRYMRGFLQIQNLLEQAIIDQIQNNGTNYSNIADSKITTATMIDPSEKYPIIFLQQFPHPKYKAEE
jgi:hypothetical protein